MTRREKGTGSVSQRKDGTWRGIIDLGRGAEGKRKTVTVYGKTEKEAKKKLREKQEELCKFDYQEIPKLTLGELLDDWKDTVKRLEVKSTSLDLIENTIDLHIKPEIGYIQIANLTYRDIQLYINQMTDKGYAFSTIKKAYNAINASLRWAIQQDFIRKNPCVDVKLPKQNKRAKSDIEFFTDALAAQPLYKLCKNDWKVWLDEIVTFCERDDRKCYAENAFNKVSDKCLVYPLDVENALCGEIDTPEDLAVISSRISELESRTVYMCFSADMLHSGHISIIR